MFFSVFRAEVFVLSEYRVSEIESCRIGFGVDGRETI